MKATKRLIKALIALIASVVLCIGVCLAWFATNDNVGADDMQSAVHGENITKFEVNAYKLTATADNAGNFTIGEIYDKSSAIVMPTYGDTLDGERTTTAVLLEISYECNEKTFRIQANCNQKYGFDMDKSTPDTFVCYLSDAVEIFKSVDVTKSGGKVVGGTAEITGEGETFTLEVDGEIRKRNLSIADNITSGNGAFYCIIDYSEENIQELYSLAADNGGGISSAINFSFGTSDVRDIVFYMEETAKSV